MAGRRSKRACGRLFGQPPVVAAAHAGPEIAVIGGKVDHELDMASFGRRKEQ